MSLVIPSEFRYWANLDKPSVRAVRGAVKRVLGFEATTTLSYTCSSCGFEGTTDLFYTRVN